MFSPDTVEQIRLVRSSLAMGFTIAELARILKTRNAGGVPCKEVRAMAAMKLSSLEEHIQKMHLLRRELKGLLRRWDRMLKAAAPGQQARLLEIIVSHKSKGD